MRKFKRIFKLRLILRLSRSLINYLIKIIADCGPTKKMKMIYEH